MFVCAEFGSTCVRIMFSACTSERCASDRMINDLSSSVCVCLACVARVACVRSRRVFVRDDYV